MSFSNYLEGKVIDLCFGGTAFTPSGTLYVAVGSGTAPIDDGTLFFEYSGNGYARVAVANTKAQWATYGSPVASGTYNLNSITFPQASADWGILRCFAIYDQSVGGNQYAWGMLTTAKTISNGDTAYFGSGNLNIVID